MTSSCARLWPIALIVLLFALWGAANNLNDILIKQFTKAFTLKDWQSGLVQSAFYVGYFVGSLPAAMVMRARGYKASVLCGLSLFALGALLFVPASQGGGSYPGLLACLYLIAFGLAFLESSANPWIVVLGDLYLPGSGTQALNVAQSFNPVGSLVGLLVGRFFILDGDEMSAEEHTAMSLEDERLYREYEASRVGAPYAAIACLVAATAIAFALTAFPAIPNNESGRKLTFTSVCSTAWRLALSSRGFMFGVFAQFAYVAAQVCVWSFQIRYVEINVPGTGERQASDMVILSLIIFMCGRFVASALLSVISEALLLGIYAWLASLMCVGAATIGGRVGVACVCATSFFMSMMYPTIFGCSISRLNPDDQEVGAALVVMAIVGGAVAPPLMGSVSDASSITHAYAVPAACFLIVFLYACTLSRWFATADPDGELEPRKATPATAPQDISNVVGACESPQDV